MNAASQVSRQLFGRTIKYWRTLAASILALAFLVQTAAASDQQAVDNYRKQVQPILSKYCFECHAEGGKRGNVSFDTFKSDSELVAQRDLWFAVLKNTRANIMPPVKHDRPTGEEQEVLERWIKSSVFGSDPKDLDPGRVTLRRLNRVEYRNTIRDLLGVKYDTGREFPPDDTGYGFDNIGDVLSFSPLLAEKYISAARSVIAAGVSTVPKVLPVKVIPSTPQKNTLNFKSDAKLTYTFQIDKPGDYRLLAEMEVRGSFDFDTSRVQLVYKVDGEERVKEEHGWQNQQKYRYEIKGPWKPGVSYRVDLELKTLPPAKGPKGKDANTNLQGIALKLEGPLDRKDWPYQKSYERIFFRGEPPAAEPERRKYAREVLERFVRNAYRRPTDDKTLERLTSFAEQIYKQPDKSFEQGISEALVAVLASPRFLFRLEESDPKTPKDAAFAFIDEYSLASRLSYLIWSSMPDAELFRLAEQGELRKNLKAQVDRMLKDPRAAELSRNFSGQWLQTRDIDHVPLNPQVILKQEGSKAKVNLDEELRNAIRSETELFFDHIARTNRSVLELLDSDYTFLNEPLAQFYGIPGVKGKEMRKVALPKNSPRGGVLAQASVLMVTSNPTRTSPVKRGLFILDNLLGTPTPPPPVDLDIPNLDEAAKSAKGELTMRELMSAHRSVPLCASCHSRMDPLGLGLENFNALGMFRDKEHGQPIDAGGKLISGESFNNVGELKLILKDSRRLDFYRCLTEKFLTYAIGRGPEYYDVEAMDNIVARLITEDGRFSALLLGVIESAPFQKRRTGTATQEQPQSKPALKTKKTRLVQVNMFDLRHIGLENWRGLRQGKDFELFQKVFVPHHSQSRAGL